MRSVISLPDTVGSGAVMPGDTGWAQAGNHAAIAAAAPLPKAPLTNRRLSICIFFPTVTESSYSYTQATRLPLNKYAGRVGDAERMGIWDLNPTIASASGRARVGQYG